MVGPIHPGATLREDFMEPHGLSAARLAEALGVSRNRIADILRGRCGITADTALWLELASRRAGPAIDGTVKRFAPPAAA